MKKNKRLEIRISEEMKNKLKEKGDISKYIISLIEKDLKEGA